MTRRSSPPRERHDRLMARGEAEALRAAYAMVLHDLEAELVDGTVPPGLGDTLKTGLLALEALAQCRLVELDMEIQADAECLPSAVAEKGGKR